MRPGSTFVVYRFYNAVGECLYVGWSHNVLKRFENHRATTWWKQVARIELDHQPTAAKAQAHEATLIAELRPAHNRVHNPDWTTNDGRWQLKEEWAAAHADEIAERIAFYDAQIEALERRGAEIVPIRDAS